MGLGTFTVLYIYIQAMRGMPCINPASMGDTDMEKSPVADKAQERGKYVVY